MTKYFLSKAVEILFVIVCFHCAGQVPPSGGPPDTVPPEVVESHPVPNTLRFSQHKIVLKFSEYVDRSTVEQSVFFSPPVGTLTYDWGGTDVEISFADSLRPNTTYIMTIGTDVVDRRNHNRMASAFALPFSSGDHIDSAEIQGRVVGASAEGVMIFAYELDGINPDTLNPQHTRPSYLTQTGKDGTFKLTNLALGEYRLIALQDQYKNLVYEPSIDEIGIPTRMTRLSPESTDIRNVYFRMTREDTSAPFLSSCRPINQTHVLLRFNEPVDPSALLLDAISVTDTLDGAPLQVHDLSISDDSLTTFQLTSSRQSSSATYRVVISSLQDLHGNRVDRGQQTSLFAGSSLPDTTVPTLDLAGIPDSARNIQVNDSLRLVFSEAVKREMFEHACSLTGPDNSGVVVSYEWRTSSSVLLKPSRPLEFGSWYTLKLPLDSLQDSEGNHSRDSVWTRRFRMIEERLLSSISGSVRDEQGSAGPILVTASEISGKTLEPRQTLADSNGTFRFGELPEGMYILFAFRDADRNGKYSFGKAFPYRLAEKFSARSDTLKVRARWPLEGVVVRID